MRHSNKHLGQGNVKERLKSPIRNFYGRYGHLIKQYEAPLPNVTRHSERWLYTMTPSIDLTLQQFLTLLLNLTLLPNLTFTLIARGLHRTFATGAACNQRTLIHLNTWSYPTLGLACVVMLRPISPELVLFRTFEFQASFGTSILLHVSAML